MAIALLQKSFQILEKKLQKNQIDNRVFGEKIGLAASLFGCWHNKITRPFMEGKIGYRTCLNCGARKPFDTETLQTAGKFYYPPVVKCIENE